MLDEVIYIPIGFQCTTAEILKKQNKRICSFPFDWIISTPESITKLMSILLEKSTDIEKFVKEEFLRIDEMLHFIRQEEFISHPNGNILFNSKYNLIFPHIQYNTETIEKTIKRFDRLRNYILYSDSKINFIFINRLINDKKENLNTQIFSINNNKINLEIKNNFRMLKNVLLQYIPLHRFKITIINAVTQFDKDCIQDENIIYYELIPSNKNNLTDEEIIKINI